MSTTEQQKQIIPQDEIDSLYNHLSVALQHGVTAIPPLSVTDQIDELRHVAQRLEDHADRLEEALPPSDDGWRDPYAVSEEEPPCSALLLEVNARLLKGSSSIDYRFPRTAVVEVDGLEMIVLAWRVTE